MDNAFQTVVYHPFLTLGVSWICYIVGISIYRMYFDHLSKFPGPKLAAASQLYEFYYDFIKGGQYTWKIRKMHNRYGLIVRISPYQLHIADPDFYDALYTGGRNPREKWWWAVRLFANPTSFSSAVEHSLHRARRGPVNHFFSKQSVLKLEPMVAGMVEKLSARLASFKGTGQPVSIRNATGALAVDVVTKYSFARSSGALEAPDFAPYWPDAIEAVQQLTYLHVYFPWAAELMKKMPLWLTKKIDPVMARVVEYHMGLAKQIEHIMKNDKKGDTDNVDHPTVFHEFLRTEELPAADRNVPHFLGEAQAIIGAGQVTTAYYLQNTCWYILTTPGVLETLKAELTEAIPDPTILLPLVKLESLPYLSAVVSEGHRFSHGVAHRLPRVSPKDPIMFRDWVIPPGTPVSMTHMLTHQNPDVFPEPFVFRPERWLGPKSAALKKYLTPFGKGTRSCLGIHLAQAEIYMGLAMLFRRFEFEVYETRQADMDIVVDYFVPMARKGSKGLRVLVK